MNNPFWTNYFQAAKLRKESDYTSVDDKITNEKTENTFLLVSP